jgi:hypothetical protein
MFPGLLFLALVPACGNEPAGPAFEPTADLKILFVGNSLTFANDLPGMVVTVSEAAGYHWSTEVVARPNLALQDHWAAGIASVIRDLEADVVVLQQGPSSLPASRINLVEWTDTLSRAIRDAGGMPALLMVWPELSRYPVMDAVRESYRAAAEHVSGLFIPAGEAFRRLHDEHPELEPYGGDSFHPSLAGSAAAALAVVRVLSGKPLPDLAGTLVPSDPEHPTLRFTDAEMATLVGAVEAAVSTWTSANASPPAGVLVPALRPSFLATTTPP